MVDHAHSFPVYLCILFVYPPSFDIYRGNLSVQSGTERVAEVGLWSTTMSSLFSAVLHPMEALDKWFDADGDGVDFFYPLTLFFAFGIWLVFERHQQMHNRPIPFEHDAPPVRISS